MTWGALQKQLLPIAFSRRLEKFGSLQLNCLFPGLDKASWPDFQLVFFPNREKAFWQQTRDLSPRPLACRPGASSIRAKHFPWLSARLGQISNLLCPGPKSNFATGFQFVLSRPWKQIIWPPTSYCKTIWPQDSNFAFSRRTWEKQ